MNLPESNGSGKQPTAVTPTIWQILVALGVVGGSLLTLKDWLLAESWRLPAVLGASALIAVVGFAFKRRSDQIAEWLASSFERLLFRLRPRSKKAYLERIARVCQKVQAEGEIDELGKHFRLDQIFVELELTPRSQVALPTGRHSIWTLLDCVMPDRGWRGDATGQKEATRLAILGDQGSGKTTLLQHVALRLAEGQGAPIPRRLHGLVPVLLFVNRIAEAIAAKPEISLPQLLEQEQKALKEPLTEHIVEWVGEELRRGRAIVLLDGLDEVSAKDNRPVVLKWLKRQFENNPRCVFVVTSRPRAYPEGGIDREAVVEAQPFSVAQIGQYARRWFEAVDSRKYETKKRAAGSAKPDKLSSADEAEQALPTIDTFLGRLMNSEALQQLAATPLTLKILAELHQADKDIGQSRTGLYAQIVELALGKRWKAKNLPLDVEIETKEELAGQLALGMAQRGVREIEEEDASQIVANALSSKLPDMTIRELLLTLNHQSHLVREQVHGSWRFVHASFQDFLAARALGPDNAPLLLDHVDDESEIWQSVIRFWAGLHRATPILEHCLGVPTRSERRLSLALDIRREAKQIGTGESEGRRKLRLDPKLESRLETTLDEALESPDHARARTTAEAVLAQRLADLATIDSSLITHAEYQLFLDEQRAAGKWCQPDHWTERRFEKGKGLARQAVLGVRPQDAQTFCDWLTAKAGGVSRFRLPNRPEATRANVTPEACYWIEDQGFHLVGRPPVTETIVARLAKVSLDRHLLESGGPALRARARAFSRALDRDRTLDVDLDLDPFHFLAIGRARNVRRALDSDRDLALALARDRDLDLELDRDCTLDRALDRALATDFGPGPDLGLARALGIEEVLKRAVRTPAAHLALAEAPARLWRVDSGPRGKVNAMLAPMFAVFGRSYVALHSHKLRSQRFSSFPWREPRQWLNWARRRRASEGTDLERYELHARIYTEATSACLIILDRMAGQAQPYEGILIVRERVSLTGERSSAN